MKDARENAHSAPVLEAALSYYKSGQFLVAEEMYRKILQDDPKNALCLNMLGNIAVRAGRSDEAIELLNKAIQIKKNNPGFYYDLASALQGAGRLDEALLKYKKSLTLKPDYIEARFKIGNLLKEQGKLDEAELIYKRIISANPDLATVYYNLGLVLKQQSKLDEAVLIYQKAITLKPDMAEAYNNLGVVFNDQKKPGEAVKMYRQAISLKSGYAEAHNNLGDILSDQGRPDEAAVHYTAAITSNPGLVKPYIGLGVAFRKLGLRNEAISLYEQALIPHPRNPELLTRLVDLIYHTCAWRKMGSYETQLLELVRQNSVGISPFTILGTSSTAEDQLLCSRSFSRDKERPPQDLFTHKLGKSNKRIKIGYLSSDLQEHATAYLMAGLFEKHDRSRFDVTAYSYGPDDASPMRARLVKAFDSFIDLSNLSDHAAAQKIYDDGIDILIDLKGGATKDSRIGIPSYRPAPIQVNYLGYPGTMGVSFIDYIIADRFIIPKDNERFYSEKVICLPDCYQPNDVRREIADTTPPREACGLPESGFVFCCFNGNYKITLPVFNIWMRLLKAVPGSVLWLLEPDPSAKENIKEEAELRGVDSKRIIYAPFMPTSQHLARYRLADLFLDTLPINAHTTASDALWAGLPVLTCAGTTFAGRVAGSLLKAAELPELITYSLEEYEALALQLSQNPSRCLEMRRKLLQTHQRMPLFDIEKFTKNIEKSYQTMWDIWQDGKSPKPFTVS